MHEFGLDAWVATSLGQMFMASRQLQLPSLFLHPLDMIFIFVLPVFDCSHPKSLQQIQWPLKLATVGEHAFLVAEQANAEQQYDPSSPEELQQVRG